jgi:hypothetical protein
MELFAAPPLAAMLEPDPVPGRLRKPGWFYLGVRERRGRVSVRNTASENWKKTVSIGCNRDARGEKERRKQNEK